MKHDLIRIYAVGPSEDRDVVRWCRACGAIVVDGDYDGRTNPGQVMKMRLPLISKDIKVCQKE